MNHTIDPPKNNLEGTKVSILCAICGIKFLPTSANICNACTLASLEDEQVLQGDTINYCRFCQRFERPPWINCQRQSTEMLALLLKKIKNINKINLIDAKFIWTQPHSKRMKIKITMEKQINQNLKVQQTQVVQFVELYTQCLDCKKKFTPHDWNTVVQVRQHIQHKKTIHNLQQLIISRNLNEKMIKVSQVQTGVNFFFKNLMDGQKFFEIIKSNYPINSKNSKQLISHNQRDNTCNLKTTISVTLPKICKNDLVRIPRKLSKQLGSCCQLLLCTKISSNLHFLDISNYHKIQISAAQYFLYESTIIVYSLKVYGKQFQVLDCEKSKAVPSSIQNEIWNLSLIRIDEYKQLYAQSHFEIQCGSEVIGFDMVSHEQWMEVKNAPEILIVKKVKKENQDKKKSSNKQKNKKKKKEQKQQKNKIQKNNKKLKNKQQSKIKTKKIMKLMNCKINPIVIHNKYLKKKKNKIIIKNSIIKKNDQAQDQIARLKMYLFLFDIHQFCQNIIDLFLKDNQNKQQM